MLQELIALNTAQDWTVALLVAVAVMLGVHTLRHLALNRLTRLVKTTDTVIDDLLVDVLSATRILLSVAVGLYSATHFLALPMALEKVVNRVFISLIILQSGFWATRALDFWLRQRFAAEDDGSQAMTRSMLSFLGRLLGWALVGLLILDNLGLNVTALVTSLGIGGIAVALAVQNILGDIFASLSIAIDKPFVIGDFIIVDELMGTIEHVGLKTTRVRSLSGEQIIFSNNDLLKSRIRNYKRMQERRAVFSIGVTYDTQPQQLEAIPSLIKQAIDACEQARFDRAHFKGFGAFSLDFEAVYYVLQPDYNVYMTIQQTVNLALVREFAERKIAFAFPTQTLHIAHAAQEAGGLAKTVHKAH